ncbi:MAG: transcription-repair coupling factor [Oscillospiraceae bacterium]|nr:transcription-repair coupling factor [Oscillospiraceae bacterium]
MLGLTRALKGEKDFQELLQRLEYGGCPLVYSGLGSIHAAHAAAAIRKETGRPLLVICPDELEAERFRTDLAAFSQEETQTLFAREFTFFRVDTVSREGEHARLRTFRRLLEGTAPLLVATPDGLMQRTLPPQRLESVSFTLQVGDRAELGLLAEKLTLCGYKRCDAVEGMGQFAIRGGILDFFSPAYAQPVRCELFGDEIDGMGLFDTATQRRTENLQKAEILPAAECLPVLADGGADLVCEKLSALIKKLSRRKAPPNILIGSLTADLEHMAAGLSFSAADKYISLLYDEFADGLSYLPPDAAVMMLEPGRCSERAKNWSWQLGQDVQALLEGDRLEGSLALYFRDWQELCGHLADWPVVFADNFRGSTYPLAPRTLLNLTAKQLPSYGGSLSTAAGDIVHYLKEGYRLVVFAGDRRKADILREYLEGNGVRPVIDEALAQLGEKGVCVISVGGLSSGMEYPGMKLAVLTEGQFAARFTQGKARKKGDGSRKKIESFTDLSKGDLVVHETHGIGRFLGVERLQVDGGYKDYVKIGYAGTDVLYVPATQLDVVSKYIGAGGEDSPVKLSKLGGTDWAKAKTRAKKAAQDLAAGLIQLYAERARRPGYAFGPDTVWQQEFEERFEYAETDDQLRAIQEIKTDMEKPVPMDRLLCGDVGFGKTEVALRAVMKCVMDSKQAAILVPTTVLAQQHYVTAMKRFAGLPVHIEVLSRFRSQAQIKEALRMAKDGSADIVIGTHRLLQKDVVFKDLGLLVVDEEQRFGVTHKERLKEMSKGVDCLTLSATPIPRTLNMALAGIRDMSTIEEPPSGRHPVQTYVLEHDWGVLADAIRRELSRGGQVYYLHNRVETIDRCAGRIAQMVEGASVAVAHGKMDEAGLNAVMDKVSSGQVQVLVCTTIIETGIDIPNVNTLIIEDADRLGLAQLHQIRGRVGRSSRHAFAYFTFRQGKVLTEVANKRLSAIREYAEFNSGFRIAMRDLEIRGAGNLLGAEQSGHMMSVGFDMYLKLLEEAVLEQKGEKKKARAECSADLSVEAGIPDSYVESPEQRMDLYRRIALIQTEEDADDMTDELIDRFGDPPRSVNNLIYVALMRGEAADAGITEISQKGGRLMYKLANFDMAVISNLYNLEEFRGKLKVEAGSSPGVSLKLNTGADVIRQSVKFIRAYKSIQKSEG